MSLPPQVSTSSLCLCLCLSLSENLSSHPLSHHLAIQRRVWSEGAGDRAHRKSSMSSSSSLSRTYRAARKVEREEREGPSERARERVSQTRRFSIRIGSISSLIHRFLHTLERTTSLPSYSPRHHVGPLLREKSTISRSKHCALPTGTETPCRKSVELPPPHLPSSIHVQSTRAFGGCAPSLFILSLSLARTPLWGRDRSHGSSALPACRVRGQKQGQVAIKEKKERISALEVCLKKMHGGGGTRRRDRGEKFERGIERRP